MAKLAVLLLLAAAAVCSAQVQVCDNKIKPGQVSGSTIKMGATAYENSYSSLTLNWPHPRDRINSELDSCITEYSVEIFRSSDNQKLQSSTVSVSPAHTSATYTAKGLSPGSGYHAVISAKGPAGNGAPGSKSQTFTTASAPPTPSCRQPQPVSNIRKQGSGSVNKGQASMTIAWDPSPSPKECIKEYVINVFAAGDNNVIKTATVPAPQTTFFDSNYKPGKQYEFQIYARNPALGVSGNGQGLRSAPIQANGGGGTAVPV